MIIKNPYPYIEIHSLYHRISLVDVPYFMIEGIVFTSNDYFDRFDLGKIYLN